VLSVLRFTASDYPFGIETLLPILDTRITHIPQLEKYHVQCMYHPISSHCLVYLLLT
jgi:hypothetical protein